MIQIENMLKALADNNRLRIVSLLSGRTLCVCELAFVLKITQPSVSKHLKKLKDAGIIDFEQDGLWTNYFLKKQTDRSTALLMDSIEKLLKNDPLAIKDIHTVSRANRQKLCR